MNRLNLRILPIDWHPRYSYTIAGLQVNVTVEGGALQHVKSAANLGEVVQALNMLGAKPRNLIAIFEALRTAGALTADIEVQ